MVQSKQKKIVLFIFLFCFDCNVLLSTLEHSKVSIQAKSQSYRSNLAIRHSNQKICLLCAKPDRTGSAEPNVWSVTKFGRTGYSVGLQFFGKLWKIFTQRHTAQLEAERNHNKGSSQKFKAFQQRCYQNNLWISIGQALKYSF